MGTIDLFCKRLLVVALALAWAPAPGFTSPSAPAAEKMQRSKQEETNRCFLWKALPPSGSSVVYLLGSMHLAPKEIYPLPDELEKAFSSCKVLVVEADESKNNASDLQKMTVEKGLYPQGDSLPKHLSKASKHALDEYVSDLGPSATAINQMKPWLAAMTIELLELQRLGFDPNAGVDRHFLKAAHQAKVPVEELESTEYQLNLISGFPPELQDKFLLYTLLDLKNEKSQVDAMLKAWKAGDQAGMQECIDRVSREHPELKPVVEQLLYKRNMAMVQKIEKYFKDGATPHFVVVGAAHLTGDKGILKQLQERGYKLEQVCRSSSEALSKSN